MGKPKDGRERVGLEFEEATRISLLLGVVCLQAIPRCWVSSSIARLLSRPRSTLSPRSIPPKLPMMGVCGPLTCMLVVRGRVPSDLRNEVSKHSIQHGRPMRSTLAFFRDIPVAALTFEALGMPNASTVLNKVALSLELTHGLSTLHTVGLDATVCHEAVAAEK